MGLSKAFKELREIAARIGEWFFECGNAIADALDGFAERLAEAGSAEGAK